MNLKRIFGAILTLLGIVGLIYAAFLFVNSSTGTRNIKTLVTYGIIGVIFFVSGIGLIKTTKDESWKFLNGIEKPNWGSTFGFT
jgi:uncharacterized membrane protein